MTTTTINPTEGSVRGLSRRGLLSRAFAAGASFVIGSTFVASKDAAWALETAVLKPETMATLIQMARDIYPHDKIPDRNYALAVKGYDIADKAEFIESGIAGMNMVAEAQGHANYLAAGWEEERVRVLREIEKTVFFQTIRAGLVTGLYNQKEVWPLFGYEGESFSQGGYLHRGFDDIAWL